MSAMLRKRQRAIKMSPVAMGHNQSIFMFTTNLLITPSVSTNQMQIVPKVALDGASFDAASANSNMAIGTHKKE